MQRPIRPNSASQAKARAKARKAKAPKVVRVPIRQRLLARLQRLAEIDLNPRNLFAKVPFVVLVIAALALGLGVTLWLSTYAAERSYELGYAHQTNAALQQQKEALERDVLEAQAAPALAEAARDLGMIPSRDTAHLLQDPGGNWIVVGTPKPAQGVPPPALNIKLPDDAAPAPAPPPPPVRSAELPAGGTAAAPPGPPAPSVPEVPVPLAHAPAGSVVGPLGAPLTGPAPGPAAPFPGLVLMPVPILPNAPTPTLPAAPGRPPDEAVAPAAAPVPAEPAVRPPDEAAAPAAAPVPAEPPVRPPADAVAAVPPPVPGGPV
jgi:cell division protein FtsB